VSCYVDIFGEKTGLLELFAPGVSKAEAVKQLAQDVEADRVVVFGDNLNDIPMMQVADVAIAVENALPEVKAIAHKVIGANTTDAVARFIEEDFCVE
jgi:hydroxymethylpyrimidine pyrophosphatase-like HAD family hydrolase